MQRWAERPTMDERAVLIVEDHAETAELLRRILTREGWKTTVATTLASGLAYLRNPPHWVILDVLLPDGSGMELLREVRERELSTRVIVATASGDPNDLRAPSGFVPDAILRKPFSFTELRRALGPPSSSLSGSMLARGPAKFVSASPK
jgi:DNA-binding response OmpR family regulator